MNFLLRNMGIVIQAAPTQVVSYKIQYCSLAFGGRKIAWLSHSTDGDVCLLARLREWTSCHIDNRFKMCSKATIPRRK